MFLSWLVETKKKERAPPTENSRERTGLRTGILHRQPQLRPGRHQTAQTTGREVLTRPTRNRKEDRRARSNSFAHSRKERPRSRRPFAARKPTRQSYEGFRVAFNRARSSYRQTLQAVVRGVRSKIREDHSHATRLRHEGRRRHRLPKAQRIGLRHEASNG